MCILGTGTVYCLQIFSTVICLLISFVFEISWFMFCISFHIMFSIAISSWFGFGTGQTSNITTAVVPQQCGCLSVWATVQAAIEKCEAVLKMFYCQWRSSHVQKGDRTNVCVNVESVETDSDTENVHLCFAMKIIGVLKLTHVFLKLGLVMIFSVYGRWLNVLSGPNGHLL